ncbi:MAG: HAD family hydrolase [Planctomycetes bacterium]|nr:HAD family hydrolase [Planctomycetota bacterium]
MHLVIFDIDGTLTQTNHVDTCCYIQAVKDVLGLDEVETDWTSYRHATDAGIAAELVDRANCGAPADALLAQLHDRFITLITAALNRDASLCQQTPGAMAMLERLIARDDVVAALATGGWRASAELKLRRSGLDVFDLPLATSDDDVSREAIMRIARERAAARHQDDSFDVQIYVGDGVWDARSARALGLGFIGVAEGEQAHRLLAEGARAVVKDYTDLEGFLRTVQSAGRHPTN